MYRGVLSSGLGLHWRREVLRTSLWFVPAIEVAAAIVLFVVTVAVDRAAYHGERAREQHDRGAHLEDGHEPQAGAQHLPAPVRAQPR